MDSQGKYITELDAEMRVQEMKVMRNDLMERIKHDKQVNALRDDMLHKSPVMKTSVKSGS